MNSWDLFAEATGPILVFGTVLVYYAGRACMLAEDAKREIERTNELLKQPHATLMEIRAAVPVIPRETGTRRGGAHSPGGD